MSKLFLSLILLSIMLLSLSLDINNTTNNNLSNQIIINATKVIISFSIDFIPIIGNIKCLGEAAFGKDLISGEKLSEAQRILSLLGGLPFGNYFGSGKNLKNGKKFYDAAKRAKYLGNLKNYISFGKAGARAMNKANKIQNLIKTSAKVGKGILKINTFLNNSINQNNQTNSTKNLKFLLL